MFNLCFVHVCHLDDTLEVSCLCTRSLWHINMPFWERGSLVHALVHCKAPKARMHVCLSVAVSVSELLHVRFSRYGL